jgi:broad specificity phosphatase PhoE
VEGLPGDPVRRPRRRAGGRPAAAERELTSPRRLVLLRHGRTADNASSRIQGQLDTPLDAHGRAQAAAVAPVLAALSPTLLLSSDLARAAATVEPLASATGLPVVFDARLRELHLGAWQGLTLSEAAERYPDEHTAWRSGTDVARGGGETYADAAARASACLLEHLPDLPPGRALVAVTHGGTARATLAALMELPAGCWGRLTGLENCSWSVLVEHPLGWRLEQHGARLPAPVAYADAAAL